MPRLLGFILCTTATVHGLKASFKKPCQANLDICGWDIQIGYGYDQETLSEATTYAGQNASIYNCYPNGEVGWSAWCGGAGQCQPPVNTVSPALCKGEPVDTGASPPASPPADGGSNQGGSGSGGIVYDPPIGSGGK